MLLQPILESSQIQSPNHLYSSVVSFTPHPREFFSGDKLQFLTPISEKAEQLSALGIEQLVLLTFNQDLASLTPQDFV
ncbi:MAG: bifunctional riboflavin kinase/FAD synthetase, partial [Pleurocapsa sp.]